MPHTKLRTRALAKVFKHVKSRTSPARRKFIAATIKTKRKLEYDLSGNHPMTNKLLKRGERTGLMRSVSGVRRATQKQASLARKLSKVEPRG